MRANGTTAPRAPHNYFNFPLILALTSGILLSGASISANVASAISKHTTTSGAFIAGSVALSVALLVAIALPAAVSAYKARNYVASALAGLVFAMAAVYSTTSALGILAKPRLEASNAATDDATKRADLRADRKRSTDELATLAPARPASELNGLIASKLAMPGTNGCTKIDGPVSTRICAEVASLQEEASRSNRRAALNGTIARIDSDLAKIGTPTIANADAAALVAIAAAFGLAFDVSIVNAALMLLAVMILEVGSGLSFAIAQSLRVVATPVMRDITPDQHRASPVSVATVPVVNVPAVAITPARPSTGLASDAAKQVLKLVSENGGVLRASSKNELARKVGHSSATLGRGLVIAATMGAVVGTESGEVVIRLAA